MTEMVGRDRGPYINRQSPIDLPLISDLSILILSFLIETDLWFQLPLVIENERSEVGILDDPILSPKSHPFSKFIQLPEASTQNTAIEFENG